MQCTSRNSIAAIGAPPFLRVLNVLDAVLDAVSILENETDPVFRLFPIVMFPIVIPVINIILLQHSARGRDT